MEKTVLEKTILEKKKKMENRFRKKHDFGKSILEYDGLSKGSLSYYSLSGEIIKDE